MSLNEELAHTVTMILAGGQGNRLQPLTRERAKPAVPFGGLYRIIDFTLSNCIHSGLRRIYALTQYRARSLEEHLRFGWNFLPQRLGQFISSRPPQHGSDASWYRGTADAIYQNLDVLAEDLPRRLLVLSGDHIYKMDYRGMHQEHLDNGAELTIAALPVRVEEATRFGVFECSAGGKVLGFEEKPAEPKEIPGRPGWCLASMGIYLFDIEKLKQRLSEDARRTDSSHDFGKDVIPRMIVDDRVFVHRFHGVGEAAEPYWRDIGTLESYYEANMDLCSVKPAFNLYEPHWPIYTRQHAEPPAKTVFADPPDSEGLRSDVVDSLLCPGVIVSGGTVERSILSYRVRVGERAVVQDSLIQAGAEIGAGARIRRAIIDKWSQIPPGMEIGFDPERDRQRFTVSDSGIVVVPRRWVVASAGNAG